MSSNLLQTDQEQQGNASEVLPTQGKSFRYPTYLVAAVLGFVLIGLLLWLYSLASPSIENSFAVMPGLIALPFLLAFSTLMLFLHWRARIVVDEQGITRYGALGRRMIVIEWKDIDLYTLSRAKPRYIYRHFRRVVRRVDRYWVIRTRDESLDIGESLMGWRKLDAIIRAKRKPPT